MIVTGRPIIPTLGTHYLGFYTPSGNIPFSNDDSDTTMPQKLYRLDGDRRPLTNESRYALGSDGENTRFSIGAISDPSKNIDRNGLYFNLQSR